jgi:hypothetical protein
VIHTPLFQANFCWAHRQRRVSQIRQFGWRHDVVPRGKIGRPGFISLAHLEAIALFSRLCRIRTQFLSHFYKRTRGTMMFFSNEFSFSFFFLLLCETWPIFAQELSSCWSSGKAYVTTLPACNNFAAAHKQCFTLNGNAFKKCICNQKFFNLIFKYV